jgi:hypothetical protein
LYAVLRKLKAGEISDDEALKASFQLLPEARA